MATLKLGQEAKQVFIDCYYDHKIPYQNLNKEITTILVEKGLLEEGTKLTAKLVRKVFEEKLQMLYKKRPKGPRGQMESLQIEFEDEQENPSITNSTAVEEYSVALEEEEPSEMVDVTEEVEETINQWSRPEPTKFEF